MVLNLTLGMRVLLHLSAFDPALEGYGLPPEITQQGIADTLSVRQSDVSRALARMKLDGQVEERSSSIGPGRAGRKQRLKVYLLSVRGREMALGLASRLQEMQVTIPPQNEGEPPRRVPLREVNSALGTSHSMLRLAEMVSPEGTLVLGPPPPRPQTAPPAPEPEQFFVGRRAELETLVSKVNEGPEPVLAVTGIPGVGKTTLARRLISGLPGRRCFYFQLREWASYGRLLQSLRDFLFRYGRRRLAGLLHRGNSPPMDEVLDALRRDLDGLGAVILLDDFHESSGQPELRQLARELMDLLPSLKPPTRLILFSRTSPDFYDRRHTEVRRSAWELTLSGLDEKSSRELAERSGVPADALPAVYNATRGHPLSIQLLKGLPGAPAGMWDAQRFLQEEVIGKIPAGERNLLQLLSMLRRPEMAGTVLGISDDPLAFDALSSLVTRSLVLQSFGGYGVHEMVREAAYSRIPISARREMHRRAAARYQAEGGTDCGVQAVFHFFSAGEPDRAAQMLLSLGGELIAEGRLEECRSLLDLVGPAAPGEAEGLARLRQDLLAGYGEWDLGYEYLFQCSTLARAAGLRPDMPGQRIRSEREWQAALADHEQGLKVLERVGDAAGRCELLSSLGWIRLMRGEHREAGDAYRRILRAPRPKECRHSVLRARTGLGHLAWLRGRPADASRHYRAALGKLGPKDAGLRIAGLNHLSNLAASSSELASAQTRLQGALLLCCAGRHRRERAYTLLHLGRIRSLLGETDEAARILRSALDEFNGIGDLHGVVFALLAQSVHALSANDAAGAGRLAKAASEEASSPDLTGMREYADAIAARSAAAETRGSVPR